MNNKSSNTIDFLKECPYGGCSAKLDPSDLHGLLGHILPAADPNIMVDISTHDDAGVYKLNDETALIVTTDFFPPMVADPLTFGKIAAANALSDVYAMGGKPLLSLNLVHYPAKRLPLEGLVKMLEGGQEKVNEAGCLTMGGHTIEDETPQYGLAVVGTVHPDKLIANTGAKEGEAIILTKPLGVGTIIAGHRLEMTTQEQYLPAIEQMSRLNKYASEVMQEVGATAATDVTGFGLMGHARGIARGSHVSLTIDHTSLPILSGAIELLDSGCVPGACFRNIKFVEKDLSAEVSPSYKYICADAQTSGGLLFTLPPENINRALNLLHEAGDLFAACIGVVEPIREDNVLVRIV